MSRLQSLPDPSFTDTGTGTGTGSWAQTTHSAIWMTNTGGGTRFDLGGTPWRRTLASAAIVAVAVLLAATPLVDVYGTLALWSRAAVPAAVLAALIVTAGASPALRTWWQLVFLVLAQWVVGPVICCNDTTVAHVVPTLATLRDGWLHTFDSFKYVISVDPPIGDGKGSLMALWTIVLWTGAIAGFLGTMAAERLSALSAVAVLAEMALCALLGTATGWLPGVMGMLAMLVLVLWMSWRWQLLEFGRWLASAVIVVLAAALALGGCLAIGQDRTILRDHYEPPLSPYDYASPLSGMRAFIKDHKDDTLLTVRGLPAGTPVRLAVMDRFDGNVWNLSDAREASDSSNYVRVGTRIDTHANGEAFSAQYAVHEGLADDWLPLAGAATSVTFDPSSLDSSFYYNTGTDTGLLQGGLRDGVTYVEQGVIPAVPSDAEIAKAKAAPVTQPAAEDVPDQIGDLATTIAGGKASGGEAAQLLASQLREHGWFSHGLGSDYPSLAGHGNYRLTKLLAGKEMVGDSEQYASAMALMARELGLPSRVVLGFLPKDADGDITDARTSQDGDTTLVEFTGNDVAAWVEIHLEHYGWVAFYPTPQETKVPQEDQDLTPPNPETLVRQPPLPLTDPLRDEQNTTGQSSLTGDEADDPGNYSRWASVARVVRAVAIYGSPLWVVLLVAGAILLAKAIQLAYARRHGRAQLRVAAGWQAVANLARQSGVDVHGTRPEQARQIAAQLGIDEASLTTAQRQADRAAFSGQQVDDAQAKAYWQDVDTIRGRILGSLPRLRRLRTRLSLRGILHATVRGNTQEGKRPSGKASRRSPRGKDRS